jgi:hypothetical protein
MQPQAPVNPLQDQAIQLANRMLFCLTEKQVKVQDKYDYYNADNDITDFGISTPMRMRNTRPGIGWASRAVNTLSDRIVFDGFANDTFGMNDYLESINGFSIINHSKHDGHIAGCAFVGIGSDPATGKQILMPFTAQEATGEIDQTTGLLKYGLAVTKWMKPKPRRPGIRFAPKDYILFTPVYTAIFINRELVQMTQNNTGRTLLMPLTHRASADRPLGKSRITNTARRIIQEVGRLKRREEIAEEFYALPQRYILGVAEGVEKDPSLDSQIGKVWVINKDEEGDVPEIGQLAQMTIDQFETAKKDKARDFCAETALTLRNLGYETANPTSAESLSAMSDDLLLEAKATMTEMGRQIKEIAITLRMAIDDTDTVADDLLKIIPSFQPITQVDIGAAGDAIYKIYQAMPELLGTTEGYAMLGIGIRRAEELLKARQALPATAFMGGGTSTGGTQ